MSAGAPWSVKGIDPKARVVAKELARLKGQGMRPVQVFCVQRSDVEEVRPADAIDPAYGCALREALAAGVDARYHQIASTKGHDAFLLDEPEMFRTLQGFLKGSAAVRGLKEAA